MAVVSENVNVPISKTRQGATEEEVLSTNTPLGAQIIKIFEISKTPVTYETLRKEMTEKMRNGIDSPVTDTTVMRSCWFRNDALFTDGNKWPVIFFLKERQNLAHR